MGVVIRSIDGGRIERDRNKLILIIVYGVSTLSEMFEDPPSPALPFPGTASGSFI
jgi:hypothetical protein